MTVYKLRDQLKKDGLNKPHACKELISVGRAKYHEVLFDRLERRQKLAERVKGCIEDGKVALVTEGMDCDHVKALRVRILSPAPRYIEYLMDGEYDNAEGPTSCWVEKPSEAPETYWRDLGMEAFEDGHPHVISETRWSPDDSVVNDDALEAIDDTHRPARSETGMGTG